jgi:hypothetical protein
VGVVTYERRKYRKQYRARKMGEQISRAGGFNDMRFVSIPAVGFISFHGSQRGESLKRQLMCMARVHLR